MTEHLFQQALGLVSPWYVTRVVFDPVDGITIKIDFERGSRFSIGDDPTVYAVYDTQQKRYRHVNFFEHQCTLVARIPRVELPDGSTRVVEAPWTGHLRGFTLLMEALVLTLASNGMTFSEVSRVLQLSVYQVQQVVLHDTEQAMEDQDVSTVGRIAVDETSIARGHAYMTVVADVDRRRVIDIEVGRGQEAIGAAVGSLQARGCAVTGIESVCCDMSPSYLAGIARYLPWAVVTIDKFHVLAAAHVAVDRTRRSEQRKEGSLKGLRWTLLKDQSRMSASEGDRLEHLLRSLTSSRTARAWQYKEQLREILQRKQPNVVRKALRHWCACVRKSLVEHMKSVADMMERHLDAIVEWTRSRTTNGMLEAMHAAFQTAKRKARGFTSFRTMKVVYFMLAGKLDFSKITNRVLPT
jgi:transposase